MTSHANRFAQINRAMFESVFTLLGNSANGYRTQNMDAIVKVNVKQHSRSISLL